MTSCETHPNLPIVGIEPALKPAVAISQTKHIAVMATRSTLASARFAALLSAQSSQASFVLLPCDGLAKEIERALQNPDASKIIAACASILRAAGIFDGQKESFLTSKPVDTLVLGCTHYTFAAEHITTLLGPGVTLLDNRYSSRAANAAGAGRQLVKSTYAADPMVQYRPNRLAGCRRTGLVGVTSQLRATTYLIAASARNHWATAIFAT